MKNHNIKVKDIPPANIEGLKVEPWFVRLQWPNDSDGGATYETIVSAANSEHALLKTMKEMDALIPECDLTPADFDWACENVPLRLKVERYLNMGWGIDATVDQIIAAGIPHLNREEA